MNQFASSPSPRRGQSPQSVAPSAAPGKRDRAPIDEDRLTQLGLLITDLRFWRDERPYTPELTLQAARAWYGPLEGVPIAEIARRDANSIAETMKSRGFHTGDHFLLVWRERLDRRVKNQTQDREHSREVKAMGQILDPTGIGYRRFLEIGQKLGSKRAFLAQTGEDTAAPIAPRYAMSADSVLPPDDDLADAFAENDLAQGAGADLDTAFALEENSYAGSHDEDHDPNFDPGLDPDL